MEGPISGVSPAYLGHSKVARMGACVSTTSSTLTLRLRNSMPSKTQCWTLYQLTVPYSLEQGHTIIQNLLTPLMGEPPMNDLLALSLCKYAKCDNLPRWGQPPYKGQNAPQCVLYSEVWDVEGGGQDLGTSARLPGPWQKMSHCPLPE